MTIAFIPVRIGSKSIPKKNIKEFCGEPLLLWTVRAALASSHIDKVVVASDSNEIDEVLLKEPSSKLEIYQRSEESATDTASTEMVMLEYLRTQRVSVDDRFVLIQATSPFLQVSDIDKAFKKYNEEKLDSMLSVVRMKRFLWAANGTAVNYDFNSRPRRQDFDGEFVENGAFYISSVGAVLKTKNRLSGKIGLYEMPEYSFVEIDEPEDWIVAESIFRRHCIPPSLKSIKLVISDVDGVLTDAGMYYTEYGDEIKKFNTRDGMGFQLLREAGYKTAIITSENTKLVERRAQKLKVDFLVQGKKHQGKLQSAMELAAQLGIDLNSVAYIGDDINCLELLSKVGLAACPADAMKEVKNIPGIHILDTKGGEGVFRDFSRIIFGK